MPRHIYNSYLPDSYQQEDGDIEDNYNNRDSDFAEEYSLPNSAPVNTYAQRSYHNQPSPSPAPVNRSPPPQIRVNSNIQFPQESHSRNNDPYLRPTSYQISSGNHLDTAYSEGSDTTTTYVEQPYQQQESPRPKKLKKKKKKKMTRKAPPQNTSDEDLTKTHPHVTTITESVSSQTNLEPDIGGTGLKLESQEDQMVNQSRLFSFMFSKKVPALTREEDRKPYPWTSSNYLYRFFFWWLWPVLVKGYKRTLVPSDLWTLPDEMTTKIMHEKFDIHLNKILKKEYAKHLKKNPDMSNFKWPEYCIPWALFLTFKWQYTCSCIFLATSFCAQSLSPLLTRRLIDFVELKYFNIETTYNKGVGYTIGSVVMIFMNGFFANHFFHCAMMTGAQTKAILTKALLLKSFLLSARSKYMFPVGRITSMMSTDLARIDLAIGFSPLTICFPVPVVIAIVLLLTNLGVTALVGIGLFLVSLVIVVLLTNKLLTTRATVVKYTDQRVGLMREVMANLKVIKFYAWELAYKLNITEVRRKEMKYLYTIKVLRNFITAYAVTLPVMSSMISFVTMWATNRMKSPGEVFSSLSLFSILAQAIMLLPLSLATGADAYIGFKRCTDFMGSSEFNEDLERKLQSSDAYFIGGDEEEEYQYQYQYEKEPEVELDNEYVVEVSGANFIWEQFHDEIDMGIWDLSEDAKRERKERKKQEQVRLKLMKQERRALQHSSRVSEKEDFYSGSSSNVTVANSEELSFKGLNDINLKVAKGEFIIVTGIIGSGKSSLLSALSGFMKLANPGTGELKIKQDLIFCSAPWIQNASVRQNILFGKPYDPVRYNQIVHACALEDDLKILPARDHTEIGERGITLSGGQKARINLARACYSDSEIFLFDDVISAVDSKVGEHIVSKLFKGFLRYKTVILATHQLGILDAADRIVFLNGTGSIDVGTQSELLSRNELFSRLVDFSKDSATAGEMQDLNDQLNPEHLVSNDQELDLIRQQTSDPFNESDGRIILDEEAATNAISWEVYKNYVNLGSGIFGWAAVPLFVALTAVATFCQVFTNTWLSFWTEKKFPGRSDKFYVAIYVMFSFLTVIFTTIEFVMLGYMNNLSAELLNVKAVQRVLHAPMSFVDTTPLGRILNRFTKDTDSLDNEIGEQLRLFIVPLSLIIGIVILCITYLPWFAIFVPFLVFGFIFLANFYQGSAREIKRLEATQRSLVFNNFNETLTGMDTIRAYKAESRFIEKNDTYLDRMNEAYYVSIANQRWLCIHLDFLAAMFALIICMLCITEQFNISASSTGLLLSYVIQIVGLLSLAVRSMTQVENEMNAAERLYQYGFKLPQEKAYTKTEFSPPPEWPSSGYIEFNKVDMKYRPSLPLVLEDMSLSIYPGEKVGICGRTGAGKSSIMTALYRLSELDGGNITIDGLDIANMGLFELRSKLSIIPQDPVLFQGTIRTNLDPFGQYTDETLWDTLRRSGLIDQKDMHRLKNTSHNISNNIGYEDLHKFHLDQFVEDDGSNFSLGERQLIALARSLVRNSKILILDEATSSVDYGTDSMIQDTIANEFGQCTILCIAHRLKTILKYDRIVVMDKGKIVEKGVPKALYNANGFFRRMCDKAKITAEDFE